MSPTSRSLKHLRDSGYLAAVVEKFVRFPPPGHRVDLFGFADIIGVRPAEPSGDAQRILVQTTDETSFSKRRAKIMENENVRTCIAAGIAVELHGWCKRKLKRGGKAIRYELRRERIA